MLRAELARPFHRAQAIPLGANSDVYQPAQCHCRVTRAVLEVLAECARPVTMVTKNALVLGDLDILAPMGRCNLVRVYLSVTTLDHGVALRLEPCASSPARGIEPLGAPAAAGGALRGRGGAHGPGAQRPRTRVRPGGCCGAGAQWAGYVLLRLPQEVKVLLRDRLRHHYPLGAGHVMGRLRDMRSGRDNALAFGSRMRGQGPLAELLAQRVAAACRRLGLETGRHGDLDASQSRSPARAGQSPLF